MIGRQHRCMISTGSRAQGVNAWATGQLLFGLQGVEIAHDSEKIQQAIVKILQNSADTVIQSENYSRTIKAQQLDVLLRTLISP